MGARRGSPTRPRSPVDRLRQPLGRLSARRHRPRDRLGLLAAPASVLLVVGEGERPAQSVRGADVPSAPLERPDVLHLDDIRALLEVCRGRDFASLRDTAIIRVLFDTGCRRGELVNLTLADWDRRQDFLTLRGTTGLRVVPISATTGEALARYVRARSNHSATGRTDALWLGRKGALRDSGVSQLLALPVQARRTPPHQPARVPPHVLPRVPGAGRL
jgi:site-specific recombinase XerD